MQTLKIEDLVRIRVILAEGWSEKTSYCTPEYDALIERDSRPKSIGQCYVTARALSHVFGWEIIYCGKDGNNHYWNRLPCGLEVDFTSDQLGGDGIFPVNELHGKPRSFKALQDCKTIDPRLKIFLLQVESALRSLKLELSPTRRQAESINSSSMLL